MSTFYSERRMEELKISQRLAPEYTQTEHRLQWGFYAMEDRNTIQCNRVFFTDTDSILQLQIQAEG